MPRCALQKFADHNVDEAKLNIITGVKGGPECHSERKSNYVMIELKKKKTGKEEYLLGQISCWIKR